MKKYLVPASALAVVAALVAAPSVASASTLPDGQSLYGYGYSTGFYSVNSTNAASSYIGDAGLFAGVYGMDYSDVDGVAYFFVDDEPCEFYSLDITTGTETDIGPVTDGVDDVLNCDAMDVAPDGTVYLGSGNMVYEIDTTDGSVTAAHTVAGDPLDGEIGWLATDPTSGILYMGDYNGGLYTVNTSTWIATLVTNALPYIESGDFDAAGTFWFSGDGPDAQGLLSFVPSDPTNVTSYGDFLNGAENIDMYAIFVADDVVPKPALAATGSDSGALVPIGIGAGILLLAGAGAIVVSRRRATS